MELEKLFCDVDDFCQKFETIWRQELLSNGDRKRNRKLTLCLSEVMTIIIYFHQSSYRNFKDYYIKHVCNFFRKYFPKLVSYNRFVELKKNALIPLCWYLHLRRGQNTGINFIDSTSIEICLTQRAKRNRVFKGFANWGKNSLGWYFGFKLHLIINDQGELMSFLITPANIDDRKPVPKMTKNLLGKLFGDRGYISQKLFQQLLEQNLQLITTVKKNMKNRLMPLIDKILLRKRSLIETVNDQLKNISQIEHTRHRSVSNFLVNILAGLIAYTYQNKKPSLNLTTKDLATLPEANFLHSQALGLVVA
ncbi:IS982 family transposase [Tolypothrix campylonemoides VB511288]|nr:IS982 family transposase [Tolypothrix campylonemoides VB511288]KAB8313936.1 IS982 family transposase [Tolypothrix campylonemoides VB511288]KAB8318715.1 IS982 family transposase [Tolypothrix campylonemoides VB511288]